MVNLNLFRLPQGPVSASELINTKFITNQFLFFHHFLPQIIYYLILVDQELKIIYMMLKMIQLNMFVFLIILMMKENFDL